MDDVPLMVRTICSFLEIQQTIEIVGTANGGREALQRAIELKPDLVLMDMQMPEMNGLEAAPELLKCHPGIRIIFITIHDNPEVRSACLASGAHGFATKSDLHRGLLTEIDQVFAKGPWPTRAAR